MSDSKDGTDRNLADALGELIKALEDKEYRYEHSCCADEIFELVYEREDVVVRYEDGEIHFLGSIPNYGEGRRDHKYD